MKNITLDITKAAQFLKAGAVEALEPQVKAAQEALENGTCPGNDFLGWLHLPSSISADFIKQLQDCANVLRENCEAIVVAGIGGSYLGARAVIEALSDSFALLKPANGPRVLFAGQNIGEDYLYELTTLLKGKKFGIIVISKSGTTTEPAIAFRIFREMLIKKYGEKGAAERIYVTTDKSKGTLKSLADSEGYETFVVPDDVGGRYSVLTAVGLLPIAAAGIDIDSLMSGAAKAREELMKDSIAENDCYKYVAIRNALYNKGKATEMFVSYEPCFTMMNEWIKQLFGESEGKEGKGLFPTSAVF